MTILAGGRLTLLTNTPVPSTDQTAKTSILYTPHLSNYLGLYTGTEWQAFGFSELSLALSGLTGGKNYDIFAYPNAGNAALELSAAWTNDSTRADALARQNGILVKSGAATRRFLGTFRALSATETEDSAAKRLLWNMYNRVRRQMARRDTTDSWNYSTASFQQANNSAANQLEIVVGQVEDAFECSVYAWAANSTATVRNAIVGIGIGSTTVNSATVYTSDNCTSSLPGLPKASLITMPTLGYSTYQWLEKGAGADTQTWHGDSGGGGNIQSGIIGSVWA